MGKALNLTGQIFTNLEVLYKVPSKNGKTYWNCKCLLCGQEKEIQTCHLTSGATKSCGCQNYQNLKNNSTQQVEKECLICKKIFSTNMKNRLYCYECSPIQKEGGAEYQKAKARAIKHQLILYKGGKCEKCGYDKCEGALQFHHTNPLEKDFTISHTNLSQDFGMTEFFAEVDKCKLLCANCHSEEHYQD